VVEHLPSKHEAEFKLQYGQKKEEKEKRRLRAKEYLI
jgi:hypothetical protein